MVEIKNFKATANEPFSVIRLGSHSEGLRPLLRLEIKLGDMPSFLSVTQFAKEAGITQQAVRKMISERRLSAKMLGEQYTISREELVRYLQIR
ncbi:MAG: helix-turn-helix domain-containing protein [Candidatus Omnitrophota bacterium]|nr:helix-turn-helix domain-containing protein [Candidatus Omnitrophota bacterium]